MCLVGCSTKHAYRLGECKTNDCFSLWFGDLLGVVRVQCSGVNGPKQFQVEPSLRVEWISGCQVQEEFWVDESMTNVLARGG